MERMDRKTTVWMAVAAGSSVANLHYPQPLLAEMARTLSVSHRIAYIPTLTLIGLMIGMIVFVPLGDMFERRRQIIIACFGTAVAMGAVAVAPDFKWLAIASVLVGAMSITHYLILPLRLPGSARCKARQHTGTSVMRDDDGGAARTHPQWVHCFRTRMARAVSDGRRLDDDHRGVRQGVAPETLSEESDQLPDAYAIATDDRAGPAVARNRGYWSDVVRRS